MIFENKKAQSIYVGILKKMSPEEKLKKACELSDFTKMLFINGLKKRFSTANEFELKRILIERIKKCDSSIF
ncbi:MAG TPA: hypothetical protein PK771_13075 [Spirochaetota bacterium]|nr:hypothetical protein [Spirochaetota bacterium]